MTDNVNHPKHYTSHPSGVECIEIIKYFCCNIAMAVKYLWRAGLKQEQGMTQKQKRLEDLKKARWYLDVEIDMAEEELEEEEKDNGRK